MKPSQAEDDDIEEFGISLEPCTSVPLGCGGGVKLYGGSGRFLERLLCISTGCTEYEKSAGGLPYSRGLSEPPKR